jgi:hypothetical protein
VLTKVLKRMPILSRCHWDIKLNLIGFCWWLSSTFSASKPRVKSLLIQRWIPIK